MWHAPEKYKRDVKDTNLELLDLKGELDSKQAKISLAKFLRANLGFTVQLISGIKLAPFQEVTHKGFFNRNFYCGLSCRPLYNFHLMLRNIKLVLNSILAFSF